MKKPLKTTDKLYDPKNRFNEMFTIGHPFLSHYDRHITAMTRERLDSKSDIATELSWRDWQIEQLNERIDELESQKHIGGTSGKFPPQKQYRANIVAFFNNLRGKND
ncbi:hypothetical protein ACGH6Q_07600 [Gilliamella sp. BG2]|uniref:hypothetical protein n=1 Tax=Gilliamella sp. BG2 TaxID=3351509 RepID=UPI003987AF87